MENILERYERYSYAERQLVANDPDSSVCTSALYYISITNVLQYKKDDLMSFFIYNISFIYD